MQADMERDHNNERGYVHPDMTGRFAVGYTDEDGRFVTLWTEDSTEFSWHCERVKQTRKVVR